MTQKRSSSNIGDIGESILVTELLMRGISVAIPWGHIDPFDLIVVTKSGKCIKVQVKSSKGRSATRFKFSHVKSFDQIDVFGFLLLDAWYFVDSQEIMDKVGVRGDFCLNKSKINLNNFEILLQSKKTSRTTQRLLRKLNFILLCNSVFGFY